MADSAGGIRAGRAYVELGTKDERLHRGLDGARKRLNAFGDAAFAIGKRLAIAGAAIVTPLLASVNVFSTVGDQLDKMAIRTGFSVESLSELRFAADQSGTSIEDLETSARKMQRTIGDAANGSSSASKAIEDIGLRVDELVGMSPDQQFSTIADSIAGISDPTLRAAAAMSIFGRSGTAMLPLIEKGAAGIDAMRQEARDAGLTMSGETARGAAVLNDALGKLWMITKDTTLEIGSALAPTIIKLVGVAGRIITRINEWIGRNQTLVVTVLAVGTALLTAAGGMLAFATAAKATAAAIAVVNTAMAVMSKHPLIAVLTLIASAVLLAAGAFTVLGASVSDVSDEMKRLREEGDRLRASDLQKISRLEKLSQKQQLTNAEQRESRRLIRDLESNYGLLGVQIDETTGKMLNLADALALVHKEMTRQAVVQLEQEIAAARKEAEEAVADLHRGFIRGAIVDIDLPREPGSPFGPEIAAAQDAEDKEAMDRFEAAMAKARELERRKRALQSGDDSALTTGPAESATGIDVEDVAAVDAAHGLDIAGMQRQAHQLKLEQIEDEHKREMEKIHERYNHERALAAKNAANEEELGKAVDAIESARTLEIETVIKRKEQTDRQERERAAAEVAQESFRKSADIAQSDQEQQFENEELQARLEHLGDEVGLQKALLALEEQRALAESQRRGLNLDAVREEFALRGRLAELDAGVTAAADAGEKLSARGTFNPAAIASLAVSPFGGAIDRTAKASEATAATAKKIEKNTRNLPNVGAPPTFTY